MKQNLMKKDFYNFTRTDTKIVKGFAILFMVLDHLFAWPERITEGSYIPLFVYNGVPIEEIIGLMGKICVALFVILSGYGTYEQFKSRNNVNQGIFKKITGLYIKYWQIFAVFVPLYFIFGTKTAKSGFENLVLNFLAIDITYNGEWWFFTPFIILMLLFPLILKWENSKHSNFTSDILIVFALFIFTNFFYDKIADMEFFREFAASNIEYQILDTLKLSRSFLLGIIMAKYDLIGKFLMLFKNRISMFLICSAVAVMSLLGKWKLNYDYDMLYAAAFIFGCVGVFKSLQFKPLESVFVWLGKHSTNIWLIHSSLCYLLAQKLIFAPKYPFLIVIWLILLSVAIGFAIDKLFYFLGFLYKKVTKFATIEK